MSSDNIELVRRAFEALMRRPEPDWDLVNDLVHEEHEFVPATPGRSSFKGTSGYREWLQESNEVLPWRGEFDGAVEVGPRRLLSQSTLRFRTEALTDPERAMRSIGRSE
jgi:hypothetical protein